MVYLVKCRQRQFVSAAVRFRRSQEQDSGLLRGCPMGAALLARDGLPGRAPIAVFVGQANMGTGCSHEGKGTHSISGSGFAGCNCKKKEPLASPVALQMAKLF